MFDPALFAAAYALFHATHGIADYWLQTDWQAQNKSKNAAALWKHASIYTMAFTPALFILEMTMGWNPTTKWAGFIFCALVMLPHAWMDTRKPIAWFCYKFKDWRPDNQVELSRQQLFEKYSVMHTVNRQSNLLHFHAFDAVMASGATNHPGLVYVRESDTFHYATAVAGHITGWSEFDVVRTRDLTPFEVALRLHVTIALDQKFHYACLAIAALFVAWR
jgi:hypothetical protein